MKNEKTRIEAFTSKEKLAADRDQTVDMLVRLVPPEAGIKKSKRPKLNLSVVLDRSGSMGGEKMHQAREAAKYCVDQMLSVDRFSTVIFDDRIDVLVPSQHVVDRYGIKADIDRIEARNSTALHDAWVKGGLQVSNHLDNDAISRILLITDGQANVGETRVDTIVSQTRELATRGISTSTIGIGRDFNEDLLMPMAEAGNGNAWHVREPGDMQGIFEVELKGLIAQIGHSVTFGINPHNGVRVVEVLNDFDQDASGRYKLPDLRAGSPLEIVVRLQVPANETGSKVPLADFDLSYIGQDSKIPEKAKAKFEIEFAEAEAVESLEESPDVAKAVLLLMNARARLEAADRSDRQDYAGARSVLAMAAEATHRRHSVAPSPELQREMDALAKLESEIDQDPVMFSKFGKFGSYNLRTGKD